MPNTVQVVPSRDIFAGQRTLLSLPDVSEVLDLQRLENIIGPELPEDAEAFWADHRLVPSVLDYYNISVLKFNYEEAHTGRLTVFGTKGGSVEFDEAYESFCLDYFKRVLGYGDVDNGEVIFFTPGLNTYHEPQKSGQSSAPTRHVYYCRVLGNLQMVHMNMGTSKDQDAFVINDEYDTFLDRIVDLLPEDISPRNADGDYEIKPGQFDAIQTFASDLSIFDNRVKAAYRRLFACGEPVVLLCYSRGSIEVSAALREFEDEVPCARRRRALLNNVTIVTIGNASRRYVDGPRYIHVASRYDLLTTYRGVSKLLPSGAGKDAVFLTCGTPYKKIAFDNHNFGALTVQYLTLVMHLSSVDGFRELWKCAHRGRVVEPTDEEVAAMITLTRGYKNLWGDDVDLGKLPSREEAKRILCRRCNDRWVNRIKFLVSLPNDEDYYGNS